MRRCHVCSSTVQSFPCDQVNLPLISVDSDLAVGLFKRTVPWYASCRQEGYWSSSSMNNYILLREDTATPKFFSLRLEALIGIYSRLRTNSNFQPEWIIIPQTHRPLEEALCLINHSLEELHICWTASLTFLEDVSYPPPTPFQSIITWDLTYIIILQYLASGIFQPQ